MKQLFEARVYFSRKLNFFIRRIYTIGTRATGRLKAPSYIFNRHIVIPSRSHSRA